MYLTGVKFNCFNILTPFHLEDYVKQKEAIHSVGIQNDNSYLHMGGGVFSNFFYYPGGV